jgi:Terminase large subunit, ATPase domain
MAEIELNIIEFVTRLKLVEPGGLTLGHRTFLKSLYGLELDAAELEFYCRATGRKTYLAREHREITAIIGRRGGKTRLAALIAVYEAIRDHKLPRGERAFILVIAPVLKQAQIAFRYIRKYMNLSPELSNLVVKVRKSEIELRNGITIACQPCSQITVRGDSVICAICDELGFWKHEETAANPEREVIAALRPAMATLTNTKLIKISTPNRKEGILWDDFRERESLDYLVWQASSKEMNPTIPDDFLKEEERKNKEDFRREYLAEFTDSVLGWITWEILEPCVVRGCREFPRVSNGTYVAAVDPAFSNSDFGFAILHRSDNGHITVPFAARWTGTHNAPLNLESVSTQINDVLQRFGINSLVGDQHCFPILREHFEKSGVYYREFSFGTHTRASIYGNLRQLMTQQKISFVDEPELLRQLRSLEEIKAPNGNIDIRPPRSLKDDMTIAVAVAAFELSRVPQRSPGPILGGPKYTPAPWRSHMWYDEHVMMTCHKYPGCFEKGPCECMP